MRMPIACFIVCGIYLYGCGGSEQSHVGSSATLRSAQISLTIKWPPRSRLIPSASESIKIEIYDALGRSVDSSRIINRPNSGTFSNEVFNIVPNTELSIISTAYPDKNGVGIPQAKGNIHVAPMPVGNNSPIKITMDSTIDRIIVSGFVDSNLIVGKSLPLTVQALNVSGEIVLVHPSQWEWANSNNSNFTLSSADGSATLLAQSIGTTKVSVKDKESGKSAEISIASNSIQIQWLSNFYQGKYLNSDIRSVSDDGSTACGISGTNNGVEIFSWTASEGMKSIGSSPENTYDFKNCIISGNGLSITGGRQADAKDPFYWTQLSGIFGLGRLPSAPGNTGGRAYGISADGGTVVGVSSSGNALLEAFRWNRSEGMVGLGDLPGGTFRSEALAISSDGSTIVGYSDSGIQQAFRWTRETGLVGIGTLPGGTSGSFALDVSSDGAIVVGRSWSSQGPQAFMWTQSQGMVGLGDLPGGIFDSAAVGVSGDGSVIVGYGDSNESFVWTKVSGMKKFRDILNNYGVSTSGYSSIIINGISKNGKIIYGYGYKNGVNEGFIATKSDGFSKI